VKWEHLYSDAFRLDFGVRQGSVLPLPEVPVRRLFR